MPASSSASIARRMAVEQLVRIEETGAFVGLVADLDREEEVSPRDERQSTDYVAGVTRWKRWLDFVLSHFVRTHLDQLEPALRQVLRLGVFDLLILETPPHAAVNEAVELTRRMVRPQAAGLTNGVLRNVVRSLETLPEPDMADEADRLGVRHSHPTWMVRRWLDRFGAEDTIRLLNANNARPAFGLRVNTRRTSVDAVAAALEASGVSWETSPYLNYLLRVRQLQPVIAAGLLADGSVAVQDESAAMVVRVLDPQPGERLLDLCAAPGGKAMHAAQLMDDRGEIVAVDVHPGRLRLVERASLSQGVSIVRCLAADARTLEAQAVGPFDCVLLDAPCSGLGVLARRADLRWNRSEADLRDLMALQDRLLDSAAPLVRPGGRLVYSTCTIEPEENEDRVDRFLTTHAEFTVEPAGDLVPPEVLSERGFMYTLPHVHGTDGAFAARLRKRA